MSLHLNELKIPFLKSISTLELVQISTLEMIRLQLGGFMQCFTAYPNCEK